MSLILEQFIERPLAAFIFGVGALGQGLSAGQTIDGVISRLVHTMSCPQEVRSEPRGDTTVDDELKTGESHSRKVWD